MKSAMKVSTFAISVQILVSAATVSQKYHIIPTQLLPT